MVDVWLQDVSKSSLMHKASPLVLCLRKLAENREVLGTVSRNGGSRCFTRNNNAVYMPTALSIGFPVLSECSIDQP